MSITGERLRLLREEAKLTQEELAKSIGIKRATYAKYETGDNPIPGYLLIKLADRFIVSVDWLLGRSPFPPEGLKKRGITKIDLYEEAEKRGLTTEEVIEILDTFDALMKKRKKQAD